MTETPEQMIKFLFAHYGIDKLNVQERAEIFADCAERFKGRDLERAFSVRANAMLEKKQRRACHELIDALKALNSKIMKGGVDE